MGRERGESTAARVAGRIQSALLRDRQIRDRRIAERDYYPEIPPAPEPIVVYDAECLDTRVFNDSISNEWLNADPAEID